MVTLAQGRAAAGSLARASHWSLGKDTAHDIMALEDGPQVAKALSVRLDLILKNFLLSTLTPAVVAVCSELL